MNEEQDQERKPTLIEMYKRMNPAAKRIAKGLIVLVVILVLYMVFSALYSDDEPVQTEAERRLVNQELTGEGDKALSEKIATDRQIQAVNDRVTIEMEALREDNEQLRQLLSDYLGMQSTLPPQTTSGTQSDNGGYSPAYPPVPGGGGSDAPSASGASSQGAGATIKIDTVGGIRRISAVAEPTVATDNASQKKSNYFPATTLLKGVLLNGLYAPTLSQGQGSPHPAIIRIDDLSSLPNELRRNIEGCRILGEAYGELNDSRVHVRLSKLACTTKDGGAYIDDAIKGVVFGEDGTVGIPGTIRANFNKLLIQSFFMESLAGLGNAIRGLSSTTVVSTEGVATEYMEGDGWDRSGDIMLSAGGEGLGRGFDRISEFYLDMLDQMTPVIQINGGREVEIVFTEGLELQLKETDWSWEDLL